MKTKSNRVTSIILFLPAVIIGTASCILAYSTYAVYDLPWKIYRLPDPPEGTVEIVYVDYRTYFDDPTGDTIFVSTRDHTIYSNTLFESEWVLSNTHPGRKKNFISECTPDWPDAQSNAKIWDPPPVDQEIVDSHGVRFEHPLAIAVRCYVLLKGGSLQVWVREDDAVQSMSHLMKFFIVAPLFCLAGFVLGMLVGAGINFAAGKIHLSNRYIPG